MIIVAIIVSILFSAFFSGIEIAFLSSNKLRIELDRKKGSFPAFIMAYFVKRPSQFIATLLIGNNIALVVYGLFMAVILEPVIRQITASSAWILTFQTIVSTIIILFTAEFLPKSLFRINPNRILYFLAVPAAFFYALLYPLAVFSIFIANMFFYRKVKNIRKTSGATFGMVDLDHLFEEHELAETEKNIEPDVKIFKNALDFSNVKLRECIVPRTEMTVISLNEDIEMLRQKFIESGYSKILVYQDSIDNIIGYVHSSEMFKKPDNIRSIMHNILTVPETMSANRMLETFIKEHKSIAVVVDEFGGTSGLVTIEDIIEEIFGEILDEHDTPEFIEKQISQTDYVLSGRLEIDYLNDKYFINLPESDTYATIAGLILFHHEKFPKVNEIIAIGSFEFKILRASHSKIDLVRLTIKEESA